MFGNAAVDAASLPAVGSIARAMFYSEKAANARGAIMGSKAKAYSLTSGADLAGSSWTRPSTELACPGWPTSTVEVSAPPNGVLPVIPGERSCCDDHLNRSTSIEFGHRCRDAGVRSVGDAYDNAMCESFFATLECELLDRCRFKTEVEARNRRRRRRGRFAPPPPCFRRPI